MRLRKNIRIWITFVLCICLLSVSVFTLNKYMPRPAAQSDTNVLSAQSDFNHTQPPATVLYDELLEAAPNFQKPSIHSDTVDDSIFVDTAIIGNSCILGLKTYGLVKTADFYARVGLNVQNATSYIDPDTNLPLIQAVTSKPYKRVILMFGENELGWPYINNFIKFYKEMIQEIQVGLPEALYYIVGIIPIGQSASEKGTNGVNMEHAVQFNEKLIPMAAEVGAVYLDSWPVLLDPSTNYLRADASVDGVHLNVAYCKIWTNHMIELIGRNENLW